MHGDMHAVTVHIAAAEDAPAVTPNDVGRRSMKNLSAALFQNRMRPSGPTTAAPSPRVAKEASALMVDVMAGRRTYRAHAECVPLPSIAKEGLHHVNRWVTSSPFAEPSGAGLRRTTCAANPSTALFSTVDASVR